MEQNSVVFYFKPDNKMYLQIRRNKETVSQNRKSYWWENPWKHKLVEICTYLWNYDFIELFSYTYLKKYLEYF